MRAHIRDRMQPESMLTFRSRLFVLVVVFLCTSLLFGYLYTCMQPRGRHGKVRTVTSRFLKSKGGQQSLLEQRLALSAMQHDVTIVTSYLNIGSFDKGEGGELFKPAHYHQWIKIFHQITNPVIAFFDSDRDIEMFKVIRNMLPQNMTKIVKISRDNTWAFSLRPTIVNIFSQPFYPKHHPNTVLPDYSCTMHAKYEFMAIAVKENPFNTKYFAWLDVGLFRDINTKPTLAFSIQLPPKFDESRIAYGEVDRLGSARVSSKQIVQGNLVWVCGCFFIGRYDVMERWTNQYKAFTEKMLKTRWISTDQQVLYYMFQPQHNNSALMDVHIQPYKNTGNFNPWFHLGYSCIKPWKRKS